MVLSVRGSRAVKPRRVRCSEVEVIEVIDQLVSNHETSYTRAVRPRQGIGIDTRFKGNEA